VAGRAREALGALEGVRVLDDAILGQSSVAAWDPLKLVLDLSASGADGLDVDRDLRDAGIALEGADRTTLVPLLTLADDDASVARLVAALEASLARRGGSAQRPPVSSSAWRVRPEPAVTPREAFFAAHERVPASRAVGRVAAEVVAPYPPGIPALAPGERVTRDLWDELRAEAAAGVRMAGAADPTLATLRVVH
jgi:arginine decarboxylase